ncbi:MAG: ABC transporter substrate-binding protein [Desulfuromonadaceae bacterium]|nr:ABC transporter substrate-binding protein [Desulfuromonadaceae bacterium]MDD5104667.1 ABC transporter substrate-binding protein [Desulfuromonadaceae bacterium]
MRKLGGITLLLTLCAGTVYAENVAPPIPVGIAVAQTSNVALFGQEQIIGAKIAETYFNIKKGVNGTPIKLVTQDTGGDEAGAINAVQNLISKEKVVGIVGPTLSQQAFGADPIANRLQVPVIGPSNTAKGVPQIGEYIGRVSAPVAKVAPYAVKQALKQNQKIKRVAILYAQNDAFSSSETVTFQETVKNMKLETVTVQKFMTTDTDFTTQATAVLNANVDLVIVSGLAADGGNLVKQLRQLGYKGIVIGGNGFNTANVFSVCGSNCDGILVAQAYSPEADNPTNKAFVAAYRAAYKKDPPQFSAQAFTAVQVFVEGLRKVEAATKKKITQLDLATVRTELNKALRKGSYITPLGEISLDKEGDINQKTFYVSQIKMDSAGKVGKFVIVK